MPKEAFLMKISSSLYFTALEMIIEFYDNICMMGTHLEKHRVNFGMGKGSIWPFLNRQANLIPFILLEKTHNTKLHYFQRLAHQSFELTFFIYGTQYITQLKFKENS